MDDQTMTTPDEGQTDGGDDMNATPDAGMDASDDSSDTADDSSDNEDAA